MRGLWGESDYSFLGTTPCFVFTPCSRREASSSRPIRALPKLSLVRIFVCTIHYEKFGFGPPVTNFCSCAGEEALGCMRYVVLLKKRERKAEHHIIF